MPEGPEVPGEIDVVGTQVHAVPALRLQGAENEVVDPASVQTAPLTAPRRPLVQPGVTSRPCPTTEDSVDDTK